MNSGTVHPRFTMTTFNYLRLAFAGLIALVSTGWSQILLRPKCIGAASGAASLLPLRRLFRTAAQGRNPTGSPILWRF